MRKKVNNKIGILGGTFDPPHYGHIGISKLAIKKLNLKRIYWIVTNQNPFKQKPNLNLVLRLKLCKIMLKNHKKIEVKNVSKKFNFLSTFDLLNQWKRKNKKDEVYFLMGEDNIINFHKWKKWKEIPTLSKIVVFARSGFAKKSMNSLASKTLNKQDWIYINDKKFNISSTKIKKI